MIIPPIEYCSRRVHLPPVTVPDEYCSNEYSFQQVLVIDLSQLVVALVKLVVDLLEVVVDPVEVVVDLAFFWLILHLA